MDLPHLLIFFEIMFALERSIPVRSSESLSFKTPNSWLDEPGIRRKYDEMVFDRGARGGKTAEKVLGIGHKVFDKALRAFLSIRSR